MGMPPRGNGNLFASVPVGNILVGRTRSARLSTKSCNRHASRADELLVIRRRSGLVVVAVDFIFFHFVMEELG